MTPQFTFNYISESFFSLLWIELSFYGTRFEKEAYHFLINPFQNKFPRLPITVPWNGASNTTTCQESCIEGQTKDRADSRVLAGTDEAPFHCSCSASSALAMEEEEEEGEEEDKLKRVSRTFSNKHGLVNAEQFQQRDHGYLASKYKITHDWDDGYWGFSHNVLVEENTQKDETQTV
jgi:hypothetical protein